MESLKVRDVQEEGRGQTYLAKSEVVYRFGLGPPERTSEGRKWWYRSSRGSDP